MRKLAERLALTSKNKEERDERRFYGIGLILSIVLTVASFASVMTGLVPRAWIFPALVILALSQIVVHLHIFLHINLTRQRREDLQLLLFTILLLAIMAFGTLWIMADLSNRM